MNKLMILTGWLVMAAALTMSFTACSSDDNLAETPVQPTATNTSTMNITIGAGIGDGTTTRATVDDSQTDNNGKPLRKLKFTGGDQLCVVYAGEIGNYEYEIRGTLTTTSSNISADGLTAQFSGDLIINKWRNQPGEGEIPDPDPSQLSQLTRAHYATLLPANHGASMVLMDHGDGIYDINYHGGFTATETLNEVIARHSYVKGEIGASQNVTLTAKSCILNCTVTGLEASTSYDVRMDKYADPVSMTTDAEGKLKFVFWTEVMEDPEHNVLPMGFAFYIGNNKRMLTGEKTLTAGKVYNVTRAAVDFTPLTVTDNSTHTTVESKWGKYSFKDAANITLTGTGEGETIGLQSPNNTVTLSGVTAMCHNEFIYGEGDGGTLNIVLDGANSITITDEMGGERAIGVNGDLKLSGNGTLIVTVTKADCYGLYGQTNYAYFGGDPNNPNTNEDASVLAADGYTVTRSARTDGPDADNDGTPDNYTWTYTVKPLLADVKNTDLGKVVGRNGRIYNNAEEATAASTTAEAMIAYVGKVDGVCDHGLAISLTDAYEYNATFADATGNVIISSWTTYHPVIGGTWRLPSEKDWQYMMWGYYTSTPEPASVTDAMKSAIVSGYYWTSTSIDNDNAKGIYYDGTTNASIQSLAKTGTWHIRACLAF